MATTLNAGTTTATALNVITDTTGAMAIQTSGTTAIAISNAQVVSLTNPLLPASGGTGITSLGTGVATALGQNVTGSGSIVLGTSPSVTSPTFTGTPVAPTAVAGTNTTQIATTAFVLANGVPSGAIMMWSGSIASIPSGWYLCNGSNSTPDLRSKFVVCAGSTYAVGDTGGSADTITVAHTHTATSAVTDPGHTHTYQGSNYQPNNAAGSVPDWIGASTMTTNSNTTGITVATTVNSTGSSGTNANLPPYYALAYIMKA
jgi:hypothetical protein